MESTESRNADMVSQYPVKESARGRNTDNIENKSTISVKESPIGEARMILYQWNQPMVETLTILWIHVQ